MTSITLSFSEKAKGWESFKAFLPEIGFSINNEYYTGSLGTIWRHHSEESERNSYYNIVDVGIRNSFSSVTILFNQFPSTVKSFSALNYEGSQSRVIQNLIDGDYYNNNTIDGWFVPLIQTDLQSGTVDEFVNKEGKWFNHIMGEELSWRNGSSTDSIPAPVTGGGGNLDTREFSTQGIGVITNLPVII